MKRPLVDVPAQEKKGVALDVFPELPQVDVRELGWVGGNGRRDGRVVVQFVLVLAPCRLPVREFFVLATTTELGTASPSRETRTGSVESIRTTQHGPHVVLGDLLPLFLRVAPELLSDPLHVGADVVHRSAPDTAHRRGWHEPWQPRMKTVRGENARGS